MIRDWDSYIDIDWESWLYRFNTRYAASNPTRPWYSDTFLRDFYDDGWTPQETVVYLITHKAKENK